MPPWLTRGLVLAVVIAAGAVIVARLTVAMPGNEVLTWIGVALLGGVSLMWGSIDGWLRRPDPMVTWLGAGVFAGVAGAVLYIIGRSVFVDESGTHDLGVQLTSGAAFLALLVIVPAGLGLLVGSQLDTPAKTPAPAAEVAEPEKPAKPSPTARKTAPRGSAAAAQARRRAKHRAATRSKPE